MDDRKRDEARTDEQTEERPDALEDLDVPRQDSEDVKGGAPVANYSIVNAWPKKYSG